MSENLSEPRKATDILLAVEAKLEQLIHIVRSQDLVIKILSNKLNNLIEELHAENDASTNISNSPITNPIVSPTINTKVIKTSNEFNLPLESAPQGFRRTSRPETYTKNEDVVFTELPQKPLESELLFDPKRKSVKKSAPPPTVHNIVSAPRPEVKLPLQNSNIEVNNKFPIMQRIVDKNGKAVFLAGVEIKNSVTGVVEYSARTNGMGKWQASLAPGSYKVSIKKQESLSKEKIDVTQEINVTASGSIQELPVLICK